MKCNIYLKNSNNNNYNIQVNHICNDLLYSMRRWRRRVRVKIFYLIHRRNKNNTRVYCYIKVKQKRGILV